MADKPSWRDKDRQRDKSAHRREERPGGGGRAPRVDSATATYKRQLDAFFDKGVVPGHLKDRLPAGAQGEGPSERTVLLRAVRTAESGKALTQAIDALHAKFGLPDEMEVLLRVLEHPKDAILRDALDLIETYVDSGQQVPKKKNFVQRLKGLEFSSFDPRVQAKAVALADKLA
jgi:hypothetical protein